MTELHILMQNDTPRFAYESKWDAETEKKRLMAKQGPINLVQGQAVYWHLQNVPFIRKTGKGTPGPLQRTILNVMLDGKLRSFDGMSAAIAAQYNERKEVGSIHAAVSGMINRDGRHWLEERLEGEDKKRRFSITERGREVLLMAF